MANEATRTSHDGLLQAMLERYLDAHPSMARWLGLHEYDGQVEDFSHTALDARASEIERDLQALNAVDRGHLSPDHVFDLDLLRGLLDHERFLLTGLREFARNPLYYSDPIDLSLYVKRSYAPIDERAMALAAHARRIPDVLRQARENLSGGLARPVVATAIDAFEGTSTFIRDEIPPLLKEAGATVDVSEHLETAARAVDEFVAFLRESLERSGEDFAIGPDRFSKMLRTGEMLDIPLDRLLALGEEDLRRNLDAAREAAARIDPSASVQEIAARMAADHPSKEELVPSTAAVLEELRSFLIERDIVSVPSEVRCLVEPTPRFLRWSFAMMDPAGPFETRAPESYYYVTPPEDDWPAARQDEWLSMFARSSVRGFSIHEAYPGHYVHFLHLARLASPVRKVAISYSFTEGWAHYVEQMMLEAGYGDGDPALRLAQLREALTRNCRYVAAIKMHTQGMTVDEATRLFIENAFIEEAPARQEAVRGTFDPGYLNYTLGKFMMLKLRDDYREARGAQFSLRQFHDDVLALGAPPFPLARRALLGPDAGPAL